MKRKETSKGLVSDEEVPSIEEQLKGKNIWKMLGEVGPGEEFDRLKWVYGKGKRRRECTVILKKSEHPVPMEQLAREFAKIMAPAIYRYMEEHPESMKPKTLKVSSSSRLRKKESGAI